VPVAAETAADLSCPPCDSRKIALRQNGNFLKQINLIWGVQTCAKKYFRFFRLKSPA
jgi:hypothetical protein